MRVMGHNVLAIAVAAIVIYAIEFLIFAMLIPAQQYADMTGISLEQGGDMSKMPYGAIMPILQAIGLSCAVKWRAAVGPVAGAMTGVILAVFIATAVSMYAYVYGAAQPIWIAVSLGHFVVCYAAAAAILGAWK